MLVLVHTLGEHLCLHLCAEQWGLKLFFTFVYTFYYNFIFFFNLFLSLFFLLDWCHKGLINPHVIAKHRSYLVRYCPWLNDISETRSFWFLCLYVTLRPGYASNCLLSWSWQLWSQAPSKSGRAWEPWGRGAATSGRPPCHLLCESDRLSVYSCHITFTLMYTTASVNSSSWTWLVNPIFRSTMHSFECLWLGCHWTVQNKGKMHRVNQSDHGDYCHWEIYK